MILLYVSYTSICLIFKKYIKLHLEISKFPTLLHPVESSGHVIIEALSYCSSSRTDEWGLGRWGGRPRRQQYEQREAQVG